MRQLRIMILCLVSTLLLSSCALFRTVTTRTARSTEVKNQIVQLPTVVDLVVDSEYVRTDTTWVIKPFKNNLTKQNMYMVLLGQLQEKYHADVIVEPKMTYNAQGSIFHQTHSMSVTGYPSRYKHFRTATEEDLRLLDRPWDKTVNHNTILINTESDGRRSGIQTNNTVPITRPQTRKPREDKPLYDRGKYIGSVDIGGTAMFGNPNASDPDIYGYGGFNIQTDHVWKVSKHEYLGFGIGMQMGFYDNTQEIVLPLTFESRTFMTNTKVAPYLDIRLGGVVEVFRNFGEERYWETYTYTYKGKTYTDTRESWREVRLNHLGGGGIIGVRLGLACGKHFHFSLGTEQYVTSNGYTPTFSVNVGCSF